MRPATHPPFSLPQSLFRQYRVPLPLRAGGLLQLLPRPSANVPPSKHRGAQHFSPFAFRTTSSRSLSTHFTRSQVPPVPYCPCYAPPAPGVDAAAEFPAPAEFWASSMFAVGMLGHPGTRKHRAAGAAKVQPRPRRGPRPPPTLSKQAHISPPWTLRLSSLPTPSLTFPLFPLFPPPPTLAHHL